MSSLEENIEQLSFGRSLPKMDSCLGLFISQETLFLTEVAYKGGKPKVLHLLRLSIPGGPSSKGTKTIGTLNTDFLTEHEQILKLLQEAMKKTKFGSKHVMVSLSHQFGILRYFTLPAIDRRFWKSAVPVEAKKYIPIPFASLIHDYQVRQVKPGPDRKPRLGSIFGVTHKKNVEGIHALVKKLGLTLVGLEIAPCSVERLWDTLEPETAGSSYAQVHFDGGHIRILVSEAGLPIFFRDVFLPEGATVMDRRKVDLRGCIDFTRKQLGSLEPEVIRISGSIEDRPAWQEAFTQDMGKPVAAQETEKLLGLRGGEWGGYAAIGAGLRHLASTSLILDLSPVGKITDEDRRTATNILAISVVFAALFLVLGGLRHFKLAGINRRVSGQQAQGAIRDAFLGKTGDEIEELIKQMRKEVSAFGVVGKSQVPLTYLFAAVADTIPDSAWIDVVTYTNPISFKKKADPRMLEVSGSVADKSRAMEQEIAYQFKKNLSDNETFSKAFSFIEPSIEAPRSRGDDGGEVLPTTFKMRCFSEKESGSR